MSEVQETENDKVEPTVVLEAQEVDENEMEKLKGDTVGETLYSGKWILNILYSIPKVYVDGWNEKLENDLCTLWDMTIEKDIVQFLVDNNFFNIAEFALSFSEEPRFTEIIVGIIGNMTLEPQVLELLGTKEDLLERILRNLSSEDTPTLVQILRLLRSALSNIHNNPDSKWRDNLRSSTYLREVVPFILKSSTNEELLIATTSFLRSSVEIDLPSGKTLLHELFEASSFLPGMLESFEEVLPQDEGHYSASTLKYLEDWLELFSNLRKGHQRIHQEILQEDNLSRTIEIPRRILTNFIDPWNLFPLDETKASCVHRCAEMILDFRWKGFLKADSTVDIDGTILKMIFSISTAIEEEEDADETMEELLKYLAGYWIEISKISTSDEIIQILKTDEKEVTDLAINMLKSKLPADKLNSILAGLSNE